MLYIHLGMPKTGTSVLQRCLQAKSVDDEFPLIYPRQFRDNGVAHHALAEILRAEGLTAAGIDELLVFLSAHRERTLLLSSEVFSNMIGSKQNQLICGLWRMCSQSTPTKIVIVVRRLDQFMESMYLQSTRVGRFEGDIESFAKVRRAWNKHFLTGLGAMRQELGEDLVILPYVDRFDILATVEDLTKLPRNALRDGAQEVPWASKLTAKAQALLLHLTAINKELSVQMERKEVLRSITRNKLAFSNDLERYTILDGGKAESLQFEALQAAKDAGISEYSGAFSQIGTSTLPFVKLDRALLTTEDMVRIKAYARSS